MTEIVFILDRSGSMSGLESDTIGGFNSMIKKQQTELESKALVSTILFDHESIVLHDRIPITEVKPLTEKDYEVRGSTALLDAIGEAVKHIKNVHKYAREEDRPEKTLFVITTDGMENASEKFSFRDIKELVDKQKELGWEFIFLGANIDAIEVADSIGIDARRAVNYHADSRGTSELFGAVGNFMNFFADSTPLRRNDDDEWRKSIDEDFKSRK
ncbi:MAG: VWA domain-containing protein [Selenomonadaceae bacterium]|nr:VWA domain-containing protein [Selenomonadaceae bacterium]MBR3321189.1 VWA domain-containing protein [Exiguobacterium sp.]